MYEIGGKNNLKYGVDEKEHVIAPIRKWFSDSVENRATLYPSSQIQIVFPELQYTSDPDRW